MKNKKILVVLGGNSGERKVSLESGKACVKALKKIGYKVSVFDPKKKSLNLIDRSKVDIQKRQETSFLLLKRENRYELSLLGHLERFLKKVRLFP
mgnify:CR=1 FL=1